MLKETATLSTPRFQRLSLALWLVLACASRVSAQGSVDAEAVYLGPYGSTICKVLRGSGSPEGAVVGTVCHVYIDTATGVIYRKQSGTGNTGWVGSSALTKADDTNVTLTLGGSHATALLNPASVTLGWTGQLAVARGGTGAATFTSNGVLYGNGTGALQVTAGGGTNTVLTANGGVPSFSATPTVTSLTTTGSVTGTTSVITPILTNGSNLTISPTGDVIFNPTGNDILPTTNYDLNLGALTNKYLTLHAAELWVETLVAQNTMATIGGRVLVAPTNIVAVDIGSGDSGIIVKYNNFASGDRVYMESDGKVEFMSIDSSGSASGSNWFYNVTRNLDGSGANNWFAGDAVLNTGTTGDGFIDLYSLSGVLSGAGPTIVGNVRTGATYNNIAPRWAIGNLNGLYGYGVDTYGAAFGDPSGAWLKIDPTNGVRIGHNATTHTQIDASGNASFQSGGTLIDENGIAVTPAGVDGAFNTSAAYNFTVATGDLGLSAWDAASSGAYRGLMLRNTWTGSGNKETNVIIQTWGNSAINGSVQIYMTSFGTVDTSTMTLHANTIRLSGGPGDSTETVVIDPPTTLNSTLTIGGGSSISSSSILARTNAANTFTVTQTITPATNTNSLIVDASDTASQSFGPGFFAGTNSSDLAFVVRDATGGTDYFKIRGDGESFFKSVTKFDGNGDLIPVTDNTRSVGLASFRFSLLRGVTITPGDILFENGFAFTESYKVGIEEPGIALVNPDGEVVGFFGAVSMRGKGLSGAANVDDLAHVITTPQDRAKMDPHPEQRITGYEVETVPDCTPTAERSCTRPGRPIFRTTAEKPMPDPRTGSTTNQRRGGPNGPRKPGGIE